MSNVKEFSEDDFYAFAGAEGWDGFSPLSRQLDNGYAVCDRHGVEVYYAEREEDYDLDNIYTLARTIPSQEAGRLLLELLPQDVNEEMLVKFGFKSV